MKKTILLFLFISGAAGAAEHQIIKPKITRTENVGKWVVEDSVSINGPIKMNYYTASIDSIKKELKIKISCRTIEGGAEPPNNNILKVEIHNFVDNFSLGNQHVLFFFNKNVESVFVAPKTTTNNEQTIGFDKKIITVTSAKNANYHLVNKLGTNKQTTIKYKSDKNIDKNVDFDLNGSYEATSYLGKKCFTENKNKK